MIQFFAPDILTSGCLPPDESAHCAKVLRKRQGDTIYTTDGEGRRYLCSIVDANPRKVTLSILESENVDKSWRGKVTLAFAPVKNNERTEWMLEKAVEIGVDYIIPLICKHSERKVMKTDRLERIIRSAANQSLKTYIPELLGITPLNEFAVSKLPEQRIVGYCDDNIERKLLTDVLKPNKDTVICIGPEGDFSPEEINMLFDNRFSPVSFGNSRMRAETAALFALSAYHLINLK